MILDTAEKIKYYMERGFWENNTLLDYFDQHKKRTPKKTFLIDPINKESLVNLMPERLSFEAVDTISDSVATAFIKKYDIQKDDVIMIQLPNICEVIIGILAVWKAGCIASFAPMQWREKEVRYAATLLEASIMITLEDFKGFNHLEMARKIGAELPNLNHIFDLPTFRTFFQESPVPSLLEERRPKANDIATLLFTSGTEALSKCCPRSHTSWIYSAKRFTSTCGTNLANQTVLVPIPVGNHASTFVTVCPSLLYGMKIVLHHPFDFDIFKEQIVEEKVTIIGGVPAIVMAILKDPIVDQLDLSSVQVFIVGGSAPSKYSMEEIWRRWKIETINDYGASEGPSLISGPADVPERLKRIQNFPWWGKPGAQWKSLGSDAYESKLIDPETGNEAWRPGETGELWVKSPSVIPGYYKQPDYTKKAFDAEGFCHVGDIFKIQDDPNFLSYFERAKDIIIRGGINLSASEIENIAIGHESIAEAAAVSMADDRLGEKVCLYVVPRLGMKVTLEEIAAFMLKQGIAKYKLPERIELVDNFPRTPLGKVLKRELRVDLKLKMAE